MLLTHRKLLAAAMDSLKVPPKKSGFGSLADVGAPCSAPNSLDKACRILLDRDYHADYPPSSVPRKQLLPKRRDQCQATAPKVASISSATTIF